MGCQASSPRPATTHLNVASDTQARDIVQQFYGERFSCTGDGL